MNLQTMLPQQRRVLLAQASPVRLPARQVVSKRFCVRAEQSQGDDRRAVLGMLAGVAALVSASPSQAAYGDSAGIFKREPTNSTGLVPYKGKGFSVQLPSKWTPSHEQDFPNVVLRYEDTGDNLNSVVIYKVKGGKGVSGDPKAFLQQNSYLFGQNTWQGATISEGGFKKDQVSAVSLINANVDNKDGKEYWRMEVLSRTADGTEGGRHNLITAATGGGDLWVCKVVIGDKRWIRGASKFGKTIYETFSVA